MVPCADLLAQALGELWAGGSVAVRPEFPSAGFGLVLVEAAQGEIGQRVTFDQGGAAGRGRFRGTQARVDSGGIGGDSAGPRLSA
ncbi:MAG: hypothetical protein LC799_00845, partial [Actinobacteria bacterium]|nr:hypothetical protein [Actinomycetota bacterium]